MSLTHTTESEAFSEGASLWLLGNLEQSAWARRLDWYLNLQLLRAEPHQLHSVADPLKRILAQQEMEIPPVQPDDLAPLMIAARAFVPVDQVVILAERDSKRWLTTAREVWTKLGKPAARVFLPSFVTPAQFQAHWEKDTAVTVVSEGPSGTKVQQL